MCSCKSIIIFLLLLAVSFGSDYIPCKPGPGDTLLRSVSSARSFKFLQYTAATERINVGDKTIGCFKAIDRWTDGTGGSAETTSGGIGYNYVTVKITSRFNRGFWFVIEVYGH
jgi:hypothetical protein